MKAVSLAWMVVAASVMTACSSDSETEAAAQAAAAQTAAIQAAPKAPEDPTAKMARAVGGGKPGAAVELKYEFASKPSIGTPTEVKLALIPNAGVDGMNVTIRGMEGLTLAGSLTASFEAPDAGQPYTHTFSMLPDRAGVFYVSVVVDTKFGDATLGRTFSIPFVVGNPPAQQKAQPVKDASGEAIEPMKAEEPKSR